MKNVLTKYVLILPMIISLVMLPLTSISAAAKPAAKPVRVYVQDKEIKPTVAPVLKGGRVYVEFRSIALALGYSFKYDAVNKIITAESEDVSFKIDVKKGTTYIDGVEYIYDNEYPMIIPSGANTLVVGFLFEATDYWRVEYDSMKKAVIFAEPFWVKPKKSDLRSIRSTIEEYYRTAYGKATITKCELVEWGTYATMSVDVMLPKSETELLDRLEHAGFEMEWQEDNRWIIHDMGSDTEYLDFETLSQKEVVVPEPDKSAIKGLIASHFKALDEKNAEALANLIYSTIKSKDDLIKLYKWDFQREVSKNTGYKLEEEPVIVVYNSDQAKVYTVFSMKEKESSDPVHFRGYYLLSVIKASDGKWYVSLENEVMLGYEKLSN